MWLLATVPGILFCPTPENLAPFGLQRWEIATMSQAAGLSDEQQLVAVSSSLCHMYVLTHSLLTLPFYTYTTTGYMETCR